jgi:hypothetical protein
MRISFHPGSLSKNLTILTQKMVSQVSVLWSGLFIPDSDPDFLPIPDPRVTKAPDPGSGSATSIWSLINRSVSQCFGSGPENPKTKVAPEQDKMKKFYKAELLSLQRCLLREILVEANPFQRRGYKSAFLSGLIIWAGLYLYWGENEYFRIRIRFLRWFRIPHKFFIIFFWTKLYLCIVF